jgi:hypothetical protein
MRKKTKKTKLTLSRYLKRELKVNSSAPRGSDLGRTLPRARDLEELCWLLCNDGGRVDATNRATIAFRGQPAGRQRELGEFDTEKEAHRAIGVACGKRIPPKIRMQLPADCAILSLSSQRVLASCGRWQASGTASSLSSSPASGSHVDVITKPQLLALSQYVRSALSFQQMPIASKVAFVYVNSKLSPLCKLSDGGQNLRRILWWAGDMRRAQAESLYAGASSVDPLPGDSATTAEGFTPLTVLRGASVADQGVLSQKIAIGASQGVVQRVDDGPPFYVRVKVDGPSWTVIDIAVIDDIAFVTRQSRRSLSAANAGLSATLGVCAATGHKIPAGF